MYISLSVTKYTNLDGQTEYLVLLLSHSATRIELYPTRTDTPADTELYRGTSLALALDAIKHHFSSEEN